jgi:hypothetical protein
MVVLARSVRHAYTNAPTTTDALARLSRFERNRPDATA